MSTKKTLWTVVSSLLLGFVFFGVVMGVGMSLVSVNADVSPDVVWFPLPVTVVLIGAIWFAQRRWGIGLEHPVDIPWGKVYVVGIGLTILGVATSVLQGRFTGYVRATEMLEADVSPLFQMTYAIYMSLLAAVLAEATFRGVIQTRMQTVLGVWPVVLIIGIVNVLAHRWGPEIIQNWLGLLVTLAGWTYLRWLSGSLWPPLILHTLSNLVGALLLWYGGPVAHADAATSTVVAFAVAGLLGLGISVVLVRGMQPAN